jgi:hypothetical protein
MVGVEFQNSLQVIGSFSKQISRAAPLSGSPMMVDRVRQAGQALQVVPLCLGDLPRLDHLVGRQLYLCPLFGQNQIAVADRILRVEPLAMHLAAGLQDEHVGLRAGPAPATSVTTENKIVRFRENTIERHFLGNAATKRGRDAFSANPSIHLKTRLPKKHPDPFALK